MKRTYRSFGKINLHLQVVGRRGDGYHELRTLFQTIDLADEIELRLGGKAGVELLVPDGGAPTGEDNLVWKAAVGFGERWELEGVSITLRKKLPQGAGLGGGSSNAATVLLGLRDLLGFPRGVSELWPLARELGADVPYFLLGGTALGVGRGDEVFPISELAEQDLYLVDPGISLRTAEVFAAMSMPSWPPMAAGVLNHVFEPYSTLDLGALWNDLEPVALSVSPALRAVYNAVSDSGATLARMSGSGSVFFVRFAGEGEDLAAQLPSSARVLRVRTLSRASLEARRVVGGRHTDAGK